MQLPRAYQLDSVASYAITSAASDIPINNRVFMIANTGGQPVYFQPKAKGAATANSMLIPPGTVFPQYFSCDGNLSVISNATGSSISILFLEV